MTDNSSSFFDHSITKNDLIVGDHVYVWRLYSSYAHHGIVIDIFECDSIDCEHDGHCVIIAHFAGHSAKTSRIELTSLKSFVKSSSLRKVKYGATQTELLMKRSGSCNKLIADPWFIRVIRSLSVLMNRDIDYDLINRNCELYALWCSVGPKSGVSDFAKETNFSPQSHPQRVAQTAAIGIGAIGMFAALSSPEVRTSISNTISSRIKVLYDNNNEERSKLLNSINSAVERSGFKWSNVYNTNIDEGPMGTKSPKNISPNNNKSKDNNKSPNNNKSTDKRQDNQIDDTQESEDIDISLQEEYRQYQYELGINVLSKTLDSIGLRIPEKLGPNRELCEFCRRIVNIIHEEDLYSNASDSLLVVHREVLQFTYK